MILRDNYSDYTKKELLELIRIILEAESETEEMHSKLVRHFKKIAQHPAGSDLFYYPERGAEVSAEGIAKIVAEWRAEQGLSGLKDE